MKYKITTSNYDSFIYDDVTKVETSNGYVKLFDKNGLIFMIKDGKVERIERIMKEDVLSDLTALLSDPLVTVEMGISDNYLFRKGFKKCDGVYRSDFYPGLDIHLVAAKCVFVIGKYTTSLYTIREFEHALKNYKYTIENYTENKS